MENNAKVYDRRNFYNDGDSGKIFLFALVLPILLSLIFALIANLIAGVSGGETTEISGSIWFNAVYGVVTAICYISLYLIYNKTQKIEYKAINLNFRMKWHTYLLIIAIGLISLFGLYNFIEVVNNILEAIGFPMADETTESLTNPMSFGVFILSIFITCVIPAITEELLFRGIIFNGLRSRFTDLQAIFLSAFMFALMHQNLQQLVYPFLLGSIMAWIVLRTGSLLSSMLVHFINNFLVILFAYLKNVTGFSLALPNTWWFYLVAILLLGVTVAIIYIIDRFYFKHKSKEEREKTSIKTSIFIYISIGVALAMMLFITLFDFLA